jgi:hypothetical protein
MGLVAGPVPVSRDHGGSRNVVPIAFRVGADGHFAGPYLFETPLTRLPD